jgi:hypothetical protein
MPAAGGEVREDVLTLNVNIHGRTHARQSLLNYTSSYIFRILFIARQ